MFKKIIKKSKNLLILGRYNNPVGAFLLMWPCYWGALSNSSLNASLLQCLILFTLGSFVMRGAGCCINDIFDRDFDRKIKRTKKRPLASGSLNVLESIIFTVFQLLLGLIVLLQFETNVIILSFMIMPLVLTYPLFKRFTYFPQIILGLAFNWGVLVGYQSQTENFNFSILYLYFAGVFLTTAYDTVYGFQDIKGDKIIGLKSLAILFEKKRKSLCSIYVLSSIFFSIFFFETYANTFLSVLSSLIVFSLLIKQFLNFENGIEMNKIFKSNVKTGGIIAFLITLQNYL